MKLEEIEGHECGESPEMEYEIFPHPELPKRGRRVTLEEIKMTKFFNAIKRLSDDLQKAHLEIERLATEVKRLRGAIEKHRLDLWGQTINEDVGHGIDAELYRALEEAKQEPPCP